MSYAHVTSAYQPCPLKADFRMSRGSIVAATTTDRDELARVAKQWRHAELNGWLETAEAHRRRLDILLDDFPTQRDGT